MQDYINASKLCAKAWGFFILIKHSLKTFSFLSIQSCIVEQNLYLLKDATELGEGPVIQTRNVPKTFQLIGSTETGSGAVSVDVEFSNDPTKQNWCLAGTITLTLGTTQSTDGFYSRASWTYARGKINSISGTGATVDLIMGF